MIFSIIYNVRHRIDGLEITAQTKKLQAYVRHRIDGLEISGRGNRG